MSVIGKVLDGADVGLRVVRGATRVERAKNQVLGAGYGIAATPKPGSFPAVRLPGMAADGVAAAGARHDANPAIRGLDQAIAAVRVLRSIVTP